MLAHTPADWHGLFRKHKQSLTAAMCFFSKLSSPSAAVFTEPTISGVISDYGLLQPLAKLTRVDRVQTNPACFITPQAFHPDLILLHISIIMGMRTFCGLTSPSCLGTERKWRQASPPSSFHQDFSFLSLLHVTCFKFILMSRASPHSVASRPPAG